MNGFIGFFNFGFLKKLDRYLLLNHTLVWNSKLHYFLFWGLVVNIPIVSFLTLYPLELYQVPTFYNSFFYLSVVISILGLLYWIYKQTKYISVKEHGKFRLNGLKEYLLYFFSIAIISSTPIIIDYTISSNYQYITSGSSYNIETYTNQEIMDLTNLSRVEEITYGVKKIAKKNGEFFYALKKDYAVIGFLTFPILIFLPLLLIIYQNMEIKYFIQSIILSIVIFFVVVLLDQTFKIYGDSFMSTNLWLFIVFIFTQMVFRNKIRLLFLSLIYLFLILSMLCYEMDIRFINVGYNDASKIFSFLLISLPLILLTISFIKNYMIKYASVPKE